MYICILIQNERIASEPVNKKSDEPVADANPHRVDERGDEEQREGQLVAAQQTIKEFVVVSTDGIIYIRTTIYHITNRINFKNFQKMCI